MVAEQLVRLGARIVDADQVSRDLVVPGSAAYQALIDAFGSDILTPGGELDRKKLGLLAFGDADALARLNAIMHPAIWLELERRIALAAAESEVVVLVAPLLLEHRGQERVDQVWVVDLPEAVQLQRLAVRDGEGLEAARRRIASQMSREARLALADVVIDNSSSVEATALQVEKVWTSRVVPELRKVS